MKLTPIKEKTAIFYEGYTRDLILETCDSYMAVLTPEQVDEWFEIFEKTVNAEDAAEFVDFGSVTMVFDIDGKLFTITSDSGGEGAAGDFAAFCDDQNIPCQFVIDTIDCTGIAVDEIYTGGYDDNMELLALLHKVFN